MGGWLNESGFAKEKNQKCGISNDVFFFSEAELRKFKSQYIVLNWGTSSHRLFCVRKQNCWTSRHSIFLVRKRNFKSQDILCAEAELQDLKVKALVWKRNCETSSRTKWKRNCVTSKSQYFPCAEAELRHFRAPKSHTILYAEAELRNFKSQYIPCAERNCVTSKSQYFPCAEAELRHFRAPKSHTILYAEAELRNFKSQYIPCAEAELQAKEYSMCGSGNAELQVT